MPRNGSGIFSLVAGNPVTSGTPISSTINNNTNADIATALTQSLSADGQTPPTANLPMGGYKHTGAANGSNLTDYATVGQLQGSSVSLLSSVSGTNTITATASPVPSVYVAGQKFSFIAAGTNAAAVTLNISSLGAKSVTILGATALLAGNIVSGQLVIVEYDGTQFQLLNPATLLLSGGTVAGALTVSGALTASAAVSMASTLGVTGAITPSQTNGIVGTTTNNNANTGSVGEVISSTVLNGSPVSITTGTQTNLTSISLSAGDWDVYGNVIFAPNTSTNITSLQGSVSIASATSDTYSRFIHLTPSGMVIGANVSGYSVPAQRLSLSSTTTVYLVAISSFSVSTMAAYGRIWARRAR